VRIIENSLQAGNMNVEIEQSFKFIEFQLQEGEWW